MLPGFPPLLVTLTSALKRLLSPMTLHHCPAVKYVDPLQFNQAFEFCSLCLITISSGVEAVIEFACHPTPNNVKHVKLTTNPFFILYPLQLS